MARYSLFVLIVLLHTNQPAITRYCSCLYIEEKAGGW